MLELRRVDQHYEYRLACDDEECAATLELRLSRRNYLHVRRHSWELGWRSYAGEDWILDGCPECAARWEREAAAPLARLYDFEDP